MSKQKVKLNDAEKRINDLITEAMGIARKHEVVFVAGLNLEMDGGHWHTLHCDAVGGLSLLGSMTKRVLDSLDSKDRFDLMVKFIEAIGGTVVPLSIAPSGPMVTDKVGNG